MILILGFLCGLVAHAGVIGTIVLEEHPNYTVQLPPDESNTTGILPEDLLKQNPQYLFSFTSYTDSGPRSLIGYFDPLPATQVIWTTPYVRWEAPEEFSSGVAQDIPEPNMKLLVCAGVLFVIGCSPRPIKK